MNKQSNIQDKKKKELQELRERVNQLEQEKRDKMGFGYFIFFLILLPFTILGYILVSLYYAVYKLFHLVNLTDREKKLYYIGDSFNPCEYMWSFITPRESIE